MNHYNSKLAKLVGRLNGQQAWAITLGQTTYYSVSKKLVTPEWCRHEDRHKAQYREEGTFKFIVKYLWYLVRYGYYNNPYEIDARRHEKEFQ